MVVPLTSFSGCAGLSASKRRRLRRQRLLFCRGMTAAQGPPGFFFKDAIANREWDHAKFQLSELLPFLFGEAGLSEQTIWEEVNDSVDRDLVKISSEGSARGSMSMETFLELAAIAKRNVPFVSGKSSPIQILCICDMLPNDSLPGKTDINLTKRAGGEVCGERHPSSIPVPDDHSDLEETAADLIDKHAAMPKTNAPYSMDSLDLLQDELTCNFNALDQLLDELSLQDALCRCDVLIQAFTSRGPLSKKANIRELELMEFLIANPLAGNSPAERARIDSMEASERIKLIENARWVHVSARNAFLDALYGYIGDDIDKDYEYIRRGGHMLTP